MIVRSLKKIGNWEIELHKENNFNEETNAPIGMVIKE
tara:strand:- start:909 stop:1019 length:111 start_codon:yes stop_codon:yes gene_type:complete